MDKLDLTSSRVRKYYSKGNVMIKKRKLKDN